MHPSAPITPANSSFILQANDRIVFLGDSITEQQLYTNYVETYLATRFPERKLTFFSTGWGGDTSPGGARRLERNVLALQPTVVTICDGMNDGRGCLLTDEIRAMCLSKPRRAARQRSRTLVHRTAELDPTILDKHAGILPAYQ